MGMRGAFVGLVSLVMIVVPIVSATAQPLAGASAIDGVPLVGFLLDNRDELGLSASQVTTLERVGADFLRATIRGQASLQLARLDFEMLLGADPDRAIDIAAAEIKLREMEQIRTDLGVALLRLVEAVRAELTPEQRAKLSSLAADTPGVQAGPADPTSPGGGRNPAPQGAAGPSAPGSPPPRGVAGPLPPLASQPAIQGRSSFGGWAPFWWEPYWWGYPASPVVIQSPPAYVPPQATTSWYYCSSARAYYPYVSSCPEAWVIVPATPP